MVSSPNPAPGCSGHFWKTAPSAPLRHSTMRDILLFPACRDSRERDDPGRTIARDLFNKVLIPVSFSSFDREACVWASPASCSL